MMMMTLRVNEEGQSIEVINDQPQFLKKEEWRPTTTEVAWQGGRMSECKTMQN